MQLPAGAGEEPSWLKVVDPLAGTYYVPWAQIQQTSGTASVFTKPRDISLCLLYQKGSCNASNRCHQVHADTTFVASMRALHKNNNTCCLLHGDCLSNLDGLLDPLLNSDAGVYLYGKKTVNKAVEIPKRCIGRTIFLERLLNSNTPNKPLHIPVDKVCGLHQQFKCLYSHGCRNLHVCRDLWAELIVQNPWIMKEGKDSKQGQKHGKQRNAENAAPLNLPPTVVNPWIEGNLNGMGVSQLHPTDDVYLHDSAAIISHIPAFVPQHPLQQNIHPHMIVGPMAGMPDSLQPSVQASMLQSQSPPQRMQFHQLHPGMDATRSQSIYQQQQQARATATQRTIQQSLTQFHTVISGGGSANAVTFASEEEPHSDFNSERIESAMESYSHTDEHGDLAAEILDMPPSLIENLHQLIMEDTKARGGTYASLKGHGDPISGTAGTTGPKGHVGPVGKHAPAVSPPIANSPVPSNAPGAMPTQNARFPMSTPQLQPVPQMAQMNPAMQPIPNSAQGPLIVLVPPAAKETPASSTSYLLAVPLEGSGNPNAPQYSSAIAVDAQAAQRILSGSQGMPIVPLKPSRAGSAPPALPNLLAGNQAFGFLSGPQSMSRHSSAPTPLPGGGEVKSTAMNVEPSGCGVLKAMSHLTKAGFFGELQELIQWKEAGMLTESEFSAVKARMLAEHNVAPSQ